MTTREEVLWMARQLQSSSQEVTLYKILCGTGLTAGAIHGCLQKCEADGLITSEKATPQQFAKRVYRLTPEGEVLVRELIAAMPTSTE